MFRRYCNTYYRINARVEENNEREERQKDAGHHHDRIVDSFAANFVRVLRS
jgi:hypothetical protein